MAFASASPTDRKFAAVALIEGEKSEEAQRFVSKAVAAYLAGNVDAAISIAQDGLKFAETALNPDDVATHQLVETLARLHYQQGRVAAAEPLFERAYEWNKRFLGDGNRETLAAAQDLAVAYSDQAKFEKASTLTQWTIEESSRAFGPEDDMTLGLLMNLSTIYRAAGRYRDAETTLLNVVAIYNRKADADNSSLIAANGNLALLYQQEGRFSDAEAILLDIVDQKEKALGPNDIGTAFSLNNLAVLYSSEGRFDKVSPIFERVIGIANRALGEKNKYSLTFSTNLAAAYLEAGEVQKSQDMLTKIVLAREAELGPGNAVTLSAKSSLANALDRLGRVHEAEILYRAVLVGRRALLHRDHPATLDALHNLAMMAANQGRRDEAQQYYSELVDASVRVLGLRHPATIARLSAAALNKLRFANNLPSAVVDAQLLLTAVRTRMALAPQSVIADAQRTREISIQSPNFLVLPDTAWAAAMQGTKLKKSIKTEAYLSLQDAIAGPASSAIARASLRSIAASKSPELAKLVRLRQDLTDQWAANEALFENAAALGSEDGQRLRNSLTTTRQRLGIEIGRIDGQLRVEFPSYFALVRPEPLSIAATQKLLSADEAVLLVVPSEFGTHLVAVTRNNFKWVRSDWTQVQVAAATRRLLWDVGVDVGIDAAQADRWEDEGGPGYHFDRKTAFALYQQIVAPVADVLAGKSHLFIASGGALSSLPFGILVTEDPKGGDGDPAALRATKWFADAHALAIIPSVQSLQFLRRVQEKRNVTENFAGYGDPSLEGRAANRGGRSGRATSTRSGTAMADIGKLRSLARLPGTAVELENMRVALHAIPSSIHLQGEATEGAIKNANLTNVGILALATHGLMAGEVNGATEPELVFTPPLKASEQDDGLLTASEIATLKLNADWVILSACNTAAGDGTTGAPGLSGLARAFFFAGAHNLLVSHWPVRDDIAARITVGAIRRQQSNPHVSRAEALQQAMRTVRNDASHDSESDTWAHPNAWAPFSLIGDGGQ